MGPADGALIAGAGLLAGAVNAVAGGGTLIAFPALLATGMPALTANITSSVGLVTGHAGGALGYRRELAGQASRLTVLGPPAMLGGLLGAVVLLVTPSDGFRTAVPFLVIVACLLLAAQSRLGALVARRRAQAAAAQAAAAQAAAAQAGAPPAADRPVAGGRGGSEAGGSVSSVATAAGGAGVGPSPAVIHGGPSSGGSAAVMIGGRTPVEGLSGAAGGVAAARHPADGAITWPTRIGVFVAGVYGSYFGAGLGVLLLGVLGILLVDELQRTNALKTLLAFGMNAIGVVVFLVTAQVSWAFAGILLVTSALGGVLGARVARLLPALALRAAVIGLGVVVAVILLVRG